MRAFSTFLFCLGLTVSTITSVQVHAQTGEQPVPLTVQMDDNLKAIMEVFVNSILGQVPVLSPNSRFSLSAESQLAAGIVTGDLYLEGLAPDAATAPLTSTARMEMRLLTSVNAAKATVLLNSLGQVSSEGIITSILGANQLLTVNPLLNAEEAGLPTIERAALVIERVKASIIADFQAVVAAGQSNRPRQTFGGAPAAQTPSASNGMSPELASKLITALESGIVITRQAESTLVNFNMAAFAPLASDLGQAPGALSFLLTFEALSLEIGNDQTRYSAQVRSEIPAFAIAAYDGYLRNEQAKPEGLAELRALIENIGPWAVEVCSRADYQGLCMDRLLNACARDAGRVGSCVEEVKTLKAARDANAEGNRGGAIMLGIEAGTRELGHNIADWWNDLTGTRP